MHGVSTAASDRHGREAGTIQFQIGRVAGILITLVLLIGCALTIMSRFLTGRWAHPASRMPFPSAKSLDFDTVKIFLDPPGAAGY